MDDTVNMSILQQQYSMNLDIDFPDDIMSDVSAKHIVRYWVDDIYWKARWAVECFYGKGTTYYDKIHDKLISFGTSYKEFVASYFVDAYSNINAITNVLKTMLKDNMSDIEEIASIVCGTDSDELFIIQEFLKLYHGMSQWKEEQMYRVCCKGRLAQILK